MEKNIIVYAGDNNYAMQIGVSLFSLLINNRNMEMTVYLLADSIDEQNIARLLCIAEQFGKELVIREMPKLNEMGCYDLVTYNNWTISTYCRLFFAEIFPENIDHLLWLDGDTLIMGDIGDVFKFELADSVCAAVLDGDSTYKRMNGFCKSEKYFNAGVMLINLKIWKEEGVHNLFLDEIRYRKGKSIDVDQSYINTILRGKIKTLPPEYNVMHQFYIACNDYRAYLKHSGYSKTEIYNFEEIKNAVENPRICHFTNFVDSRPWFFECTHPAASIWREYLSMSPWADFEMKHLFYRRNWFREEVRHKLMRGIYFIPVTRLLWIRIKYGYWQRKQSCICERNFSE